MTRRDPRDPLDLSVPSVRHTLRRSVPAPLSSSLPASSRMSGWGLIELMITLACVGIVLSWATSQYTSHRQHSQRAQARAQLLQTALWMERSASANGRYPLASDFSLGPNSPVYLSARAELHYQFKLESTAATYTLLAIPTGPQRSDPCGTLTLNHLGERSAQHADASSHANTCWLR